MTAEHGPIAARDRGDFSVALEGVCTAELMFRAAGEARDLFLAEVALAVDEVRSELKRFRTVLIAAAIAAFSLLLVVTMLAFALVLALGGTALAALGACAIFFLVFAIAAFVAKSSLPENPLARTRERLSSDVQTLKEHIG